MATNTYDNRITKKASEEIVRYIDWATKALRTGDSVATSAWAEVGTNALTLDSAGVSSNITYVRIIGGTVGNTYLIRNTITTSQSPVEKLEEDTYVIVE